MLFVSLTSPGEPASPWMGGALSTCRRAFPRTANALSSAAVPQPIRSLLAIFALVGVSLLASSAAFALEPHTWVSGVGNDASLCTRFEPCKTFAGAISKTEAGGLITPLDPGGFGAVTIVKSITIDGSDMFGGVLVLGTNGIVVAAGPRDRVVLRGVRLEGEATGCPSGTAGLNGIRYISGGSLVVDDVTVQGFAQDAITAALSTDGSLTVANSDLRDNCGNGVSAATSSGYVSVSISNNFISGNGTAVSAGQNSTVTLSKNTISDNATGFASTGTGRLLSFGDNHIAGNSTEGVMPAEPSSPPRQTSPPSVPTPAVIEETVLGPVPRSIVTYLQPLCRVPSLRGKTLSAVRRMLRRTNCEFGTVTYKPRRGRHHTNKVYRQAPKAGAIHYKGAVVTSRSTGPCHGRIAPRLQLRAGRPVPGSPG